MDYFEGDNNLAYLFQVFKVYFCYPSKFLLPKFKTSRTFFKKIKSIYMATNKYPYINSF